MSGFDADWLDLREPADARARQRMLAAQLAAAPHADAMPRGPLQIVDLGGGTGANLRWLAPVLGGHQHWVCADHDPALLGALPERLRGWATARGFTLDPAGDATGTTATIGFRSPALQVTITRTLVDLSRRLDTLTVPDGSVVTASALLDLVSTDWIEALSARIADAGASALFALTYDGRFWLDPAEPEDASLRELVNRHQRGDKGFGPALGPAATDAAAAALAARGYRVARAQSDWALEPADAALQRALITGWAAAAREIAPGGGLWIDHWLERRAARIEARGLRIVVGHEDLLALPPS